MSRKFTKIIFVVWLLLSTLAIAVSLWQMILEIKNYQYVYELWLGIKPDNSLDKTLNESTHNMIRLILVFSCSFLSFCSVIVMIIIKGLPTLQPLLDNLNERKQKHAQAKAERADRAKQAKIAELEQQLEELKKE